MTSIVASFFTPGTASTAMAGGVAAGDFGAALTLAGEAAAPSVPARLPTIKAMTLPSILVLPKAEAATPTPDADVPAAASTPAKLPTIRSMTLPSILVVSDPARSPAATPSEAAPLERPTNKPMTPASVSMAPNDDAARTPLAAEPAATNTSPKLPTTKTTSAIMVAADADAAPLPVAEKPVPARSPTEPQALATAPVVAKAAPTTRSVIVADAPKSVFAANRPTANVPTVQAPPDPAEPVQPGVRSDVAATPAPASTHEAASEELTEEEAGVSARTPDRPAAHPIQIPTPAATSPMPAAAPRSAQAEPASAAPTAPAARAVRGRAPPSADEAPRERDKPIVHLAAPEAILIPATPLPVVSPERPVQIATPDRIEASMPTASATAIDIAEPVRPAPDDPAEPVPPAPIDAAEPARPAQDKAPVDFAARLSAPSLPDPATSTPQPTVATPQLAAVAPPPRATAPPAPKPDAAVVTARPGRIGHEMGVVIARHAATGGGEAITVRLDPAEMGRIEVSLSFDDGGTLRAVVAADVPASLDLLRRDSADLNRALADAGVRSDQQSLRFDTRSGGGDQPGNGPAWQRRADPRTTAADEPDTRPDYRPRAVSGRIDMMA